MKFRTQTEATPNHGGGFGRSAPKPDWMIEWLADQPRYVKLECGSTADLNEPKTAQWRGSTMIAVECDKCQTFCTVTRKIPLAERLEIPPDYPTEPPF